MKSTLLLLLFSTAAAVMQAADPAGLVYWPKGLPPGGAKGSKFDNHSVSVSHRDKSGGAEVHENQTDIFFVQSGTAKLVLGGEVTNGKTETPGEIRGETIRNGVEKTLNAGDMVHIPPGMPHQFLLDPGKEITYLVVKVTKP